jgi:hypothetical protein
MISATVEIEGKRIKIGVNEDLIAAAEHTIPLALEHRKKAPVRFTCFACLSRITSAARLWHAVAVHDEKQFSQ